ncbi:hypothetical protein QCA50_005692 [Cerrena zonata]|uniref:CRAL-TRIO domain-containing protein n=1 Tax=Cerrena zonata TaxID=2478898 RepID=A0AAW0GAE0_9APHY
MPQAYVPVVPPNLADASHVKPQGTDLTDKQRAEFEKVLTYFSQENYQLPEVEEEKASLSDEEKCWLSFECMLRYLRATKWAGSDAAIKRIEGTLRWRREFGFYDKLTAEYVEPEAVTGKMVIFGFDVDGRPALYLCPSRQNTNEGTGQIEFTFWMLERVIDLMGPGIENLDLMINFADKAKNPTLGVARTVLSHLQTHYPEHLGKAIIINLPFLVNAFFKVITPFVDPVTRPKMRFNPEIVKEGIFTQDACWKEFGGDVEFVYEHDKYWPALVGLVNERKKKRMERWKALGGRVGLKEWDMRSEGEEEELEKVEVEHVQVCCYCRVGKAAYRSRD